MTMHLIGLALLFVAGAAVILAVLVAFIPLRVKLERTTKPFKERWTVPASLSVACAVLAAVGTPLIGSSSNIPPQDPPPQLNIPLAISIASPTGQVSPTGQAFGGQVEGLLPSQTIWFFSKQVTDPSGPITSGVIVVNQGPCDVTGANWSCQNVVIGGIHPQDSGSYQVWAAVVEPWQARQLQNDLVNNKSVVSGDEPPHAASGIDSENVTRLSYTGTPTTPTAGSGTHPSSPPTLKLNISVVCRIPPGLHEGQRVTAVYKITSNQAVKVGLGVGVYDSGGIDQSDGTGDTDGYQLTAGTHMVTHVLELPSGLSADQYEIVAEIWPNGKIGATGADVLAEATCGFFKVS
jgi:hypothetical protein